MTIIHSDYIQFVNQASPPATPAAGTVRLYVGTDGELKFINSSGTVESYGIPDPTFEGLSDVVFTSLTTGEYLSYDNGNWVNVDLGTIPVQLTDFGNFVSTAGGSNDNNDRYGNSVQFLGSNWLPRVLAPATALNFDEEIVRNVADSNSLKDINFSQLGMGGDQDITEGGVADDVLVLYSENLPSGTAFDEGAYMITLNIYFDPTTVTGNTQLNGFSPSGGYGYGGFGFTRIRVFFRQYDQTQNPTSPTESILVLEADIPDTGQEYVLHIPFPGEISPFGTGEKHIAIVTEKTVTGDSITASGTAMFEKVGHRIDGGSVT